MEFCALGLAALVKGMPTMKTFISVFYRVKRLPALT